MFLPLPPRSPLRGLIGPAGGKPPVHIFPHRLAEKVAINVDEGVDVLATGGAAFFFLFFEDAPPPLGLFFVFCFVLTRKESVIGASLEPGHDLVVEFVPRPRRPVHGLRNVVPRIRRISAMVKHPRQYIFHLRHPAFSVHGQTQYPSDPHSPRHLDLHHLAHVERVPSQLHVQHRRRLHNFQDALRVPLPPASTAAVRVITRECLRGQVRRETRIDVRARGHDGDAHIVEFFRTGARDAAPAARGDVLAFSSV
mmetsp:Transcript_42577/g.83721  ORF Transcript_42577/g.83721 Transcript_42577/m.83721 type:complete len:253 (-) Transcript_42577:55-813(-)